MPTLRWFGTIVVCEAPYSPRGMQWEACFEMDSPGRPTDMDIRRFVSTFYHGAHRCELISIGSLTQLAFAPGRYIGVMFLA
jgi:hypothetical protein